MTARGGLRAAIVGAGLMGRWHARGVRHANGLVAAVVDADLQRASTLARRHGAAVVARTLGEAASATPIDVAHVCTPLGTHEAVATEAIATGIHALVEKPLAASATVTRELLRAASERGVLLCPVHQFPMQRGMREVVRALPRLGPTLHVQTIACSAGAAEGNERLADGVAADILPHPLSLFASVIEMPLASVSWSAFRPRPGELLVAGVAGTVTLSLIVSMSGRPTTNALRLTGAKGTAHADLFHGFAVIEAPGVSRARKILHPFTLAGATLTRASGNLLRRVFVGESAYPGLRELIAAFHAAVRGEGSSPIPSARILDIAVARDAILRQATGDPA